ncbi:hypothetical protein D3OALGA1CA_5635 [Olavius algarvensis associated proteobacterium Delta 3]|nr:hypothetical protein D3OALGA1CA_5635 [Olavius algarvensis associated proteobacterium Delta 3]
MTFATGKLDGYSRTGYSLLRTDSEMIDGSPTTEYQIPNTEYLRLANGPNRQTGQRANGPTGQRAHGYRYF